MGGRIIDGWHAFQYRLADGCAPAPFTGKLATYRVRLRAVDVDPCPLPPRNPRRDPMPDPAGLRRRIGTKIPIACGRN